MRIVVLCFIISVVNQLIFSDKYTLMFVGIAAGLTIGLISKMIYFPATLIALWIVWPLLAFVLLFDQTTIGALIVTTFMSLTGAFTVFGRLYRIGKKLDKKNPLN